jgi:hypothetical protein
MSLRRQQGGPTDPEHSDFRVNIGGVFTYHDAARIRGDFPDLELPLTGGSEMCGKRSKPMSLCTQGENKERRFRNLQESFST